VKSNNLNERYPISPPRTSRSFATGFLEFDARVWDEQIEADLKAGKLDKVITEARTEYEKGKTRPL